MIFVERWKLDKAWRIASATSKGIGAVRWTEIHVYHVPAEFAETMGAPMRRFVAEVIGRSTMQGERTRTRRVGTGTLERALNWIDDTDLGAAVKVMATEWEIEQGESANVNEA